ncbi:amino acid-binding ACT domain-containing protein [Leucobacter viscericola]|uniref:Amino acid-binding ACT domain-containing protein n=1 Tax=Leucobacter viscericola TaxID=2714935 RepID=A0A6G7XCG9_9MICO|nr:amino acid-binding ACT domain-containing protein [Leucobacter viscericola]QIK62139.1 amino acid-binding ACT domain-containing protein [Leucobacter viscericola]
MKDIAIPAPNGAQSVAKLARVLGDAGVGLEGGGMWSGVAHYLVDDGDAALSALTAAGIGGAQQRDVVIAELEADVPGALGRMMTKLADAGVQLEGQYSDHDNRKILLVTDVSAAEAALA